jgi:hypothetical protein
LKSLPVGICTNLISFDLVLFVVRFSVVFQAFAGQ